MAYFIRFTENPQEDMERGYSFVGYVLMDTAAKMYEFHAEITGEAFEDDFDLDAYMSDNPDTVAQDNLTGKWGITRSGLCGFGPYTSIEEAEAHYQNEPEHFSQYSHYQFHVFEGTETFSEKDTQDDGTTFAPKAIVR